MPEQFDAIIFDMDGTLIDTNDLIITSLNITIEHFLNRKPSEEEKTHVLGLPLLEQMEYFDSSRAQEMTKLYRDYYRDHMEEETYLFDGVKDLLKEIKKLGHPIAVVSNKSRKGLDHAFEKFKLDEIDYSISAEEVVLKKPHPEGLIKAMDHFKVPKEATYFIGDSSHDILAAKAAGAYSVLVDWSVIDFDHLLKAGPDSVISHPMDLLEILR